MPVSISSRVTSAPATLLAQASNTGSAGRNLGKCLGSENASVDASIVEATEARAAAGPQQRFTVRRDPQGQGALRPIFTVGDGRARTGRTTVERRRPTRAPPSLELR